MVWAHDRFEGGATKSAVPAIGSEVSVALVRGRRERRPLSSFGPVPPEVRVAVRDRHHRTTVARRTTSWA
jgi:hypothetical protein